MKQFAVLSLGTAVLWLAAAPAFAQSFNINGTEVRPFYESTPTGRVDDNLVPATDRFNMLESSTAVGLSFSLGGSGRSLVLPWDLSDSAFDIYVNPLHIGQAWHSADAALMTDVALQLAEGERVLLRARKGLSAKEAFEVAVRVATERQDKVALERIAKYAAQANDAELTTSAAAAQKLASVSRDTTSRMLIDPEQIDLKRFGLMHDCFGHIRMAKIAGDVRSIELIEKEYLPYVPDSCLEGMTKCLGEARNIIESSKPLPPELTERLKRLALISRRDVDHEADTTEVPEDTTATTAILPENVTSSY